MVSVSLSSRSYPRVVEDHPAPPSMTPLSCPAPPYTPRRPPIYTPTPNERLHTEIYISLPVPARLAPVRSESGRSESPFTAQGRAWDTFFGRSARSKPSREKRPTRSVVTEETGSEPETMAKHLFWYGFVFPLFWVLGIFVLFSPLKSLEDPVSISVDAASTSSITSTTPRRVHAEDLDLVRATERRWALRCCLACFVFLLVLAGVIVALWTAHVGSFASRS